MTEITYWVLTLILLNCTVTPVSSTFELPHRSILREITQENNDDVADYAVDLDASSIDVVLRDTPAAFAVVEFYANWCPACRRYKPKYEKVARLFNGPEAVHPGVVLLTRVDCAQKMNTGLCINFSVSHYPMLFWSHPSKFVAGSWEPKLDKSDIQLINNGYTSESLLDWINKQMGSSFSLDDEKIQNGFLQPNSSDTQQIAEALHDIEEATYTAFEIIFQHKMIKPETRASLIKFLQLLVAHHPSLRCRNGIAELLVNFDELYPIAVLSENEQEDYKQKTILRTFQICGKDVPRGHWMFCQGSINDTRGFSCGLWIILHSLSLRIEDGESEFAFTAICDFIHNFFVCEECRQHFENLCSSVSAPFSKARDFAIWLWTAHNKVNERLIKEEAGLGTGDPKFPKVLWPPKQLCSACYLLHDPKNSKIEWNLDMVYIFLISYYGRALVSFQKDNSNLVNDVADGGVEDLANSGNAVAVPVGAALAIALVSCAFGSLACYWRARQKRWKYYHHTRSFKEI